MKKIIICLLCLLGIAGCSKKERFVFNEEIDNSFTEYINNYTKNSFSSNPMDANFYFLNPELFGIENKGYKGIDITEPNKEGIKNVIDEIKDFNYNSLSYENRITYEVIVDHLEIELEMVDYYYYQTSLGSYLGYQAQLPVLLYFYRFDDVSDIEDYFSYLEKTENDFKQIIDFELKRKNKNLATASVVLEGTVEQCKTVYEEQDYFLAKTFEGRIVEMELENEEELITRNNDLVKKFQGAYKFLADEINNQLLEQTNSNNINTYKNGTKYYELLVRKATGSKKSIPQIKADLESAINDLMFKIDDLTITNLTNQDYSDILSSYISNENIWKDFPKLKDPNEPGKDLKINYNLNIIDQSLEDNFSPAAYLTSPLDAIGVQQIIINEKQILQQAEFNSNYLYTVMAHEGVPGHMYQDLYFKTSTNYNYLRGLLDCIGYTEGWATYVQYYALKYTELSPEEYKNMVYLELASGYLTCYLDIQINYYGWNEEHVTSFLISQGNSGDIGKQIYNQLIEVPTNSLQYYYGYLQFEQLKKKARKILGENYSDLIFHTYVLDMGSMPFYILEKHLDDIKNLVN